jgi:hypothetical protein
VIIYGAGRGLGKTNAVVNWLMEDPQARVILVSQLQRKHHLLRLIGQRTNYTSSKAFWDAKIIVANNDLDYLLRGRRFHAREVAVDDFQEVFRSLVGIPIGLVTCNATVIKEPTFDDTVDGDIIDAEFDENNPWDRKEIERDVKQIGSSIRRGLEF